jgi:hypothetical protein
VTVFRVDFGRYRRDPSVERVPGACLRGDARGHTDAQATGFQLGHACFEFHHTQIGDDDHRVIARPDQAACVEMALDDDATDGRGESRVALYLSGPPECGFGLRDICPGQISLSGSSTSGGLRGVEPLPRHCSPVEQILSAIVLEHRIRERRFGRLETRLCDRYRGCRRVNLRVDFATVEGRYNLTRRYAISEINGHSRERAGQPCRNRDATLRHEVAGNLQRGFDVRHANFERGDVNAPLHSGRRCCRGRLRTAARRYARGDSDEGNTQNGSRDDRSRDGW